MDIKDLLKLISRISFTGPGGIERIVKVLKELVEKLNTVVTEEEIEEILSNYYTKEEAQTILSGYVTDTQIQAYYTKEQVDLIVSALDKNSYRVAWDGSTQPIVANIPAGIVVTYNNTDYTGTLSASTNTINSIYLVGQDMYVTSKDGDIYSWVFAGTTELDLNDYATKDELGQLEAEVDGVNGNFLPGYRSPKGEDEGLIRNSSRAVSVFFAVAPNDVIVWQYNGASDMANLFLTLYDSSKKYLDYYSASAANSRTITIGSSSSSRFAIATFYYDSATGLINPGSKVTINGVTVWEPIYEQDALLSNSVLSFPQDLNKTEKEQAQNNIDIPSLFSGKRQNYVTGGYVTADGAYKEHSDWAITDFIPFTSGTITWRFGVGEKVGTSWPCLGLYDSNKDYINLYTSKGYINERTFTVTLANVAYIRASFSRLFSGEDNFIPVTLNGTDFKITDKVDNLVEEPGKKWRPLTFGTFVQADVSRGGSLNYSGAYAPKRVSSKSLCCVPYEGAKIRLRTPLDTPYLISCVAYYAGSDGNIQTSVLLTGPYDEKQFPSSAKTFRLSFRCQFKYNQAGVGNWKDLTPSEVNTWMQAGKLAVEYQEPDTLEVVARNIGAANDVSAVRRVLDLVTNEDNGMDKLPLFAHTSDLHGDAVRFQNLLDYVTEEGGFDAVLNTGDATMYKHDSNTDWVDKMCENFATKMLFCIGNHESWPTGQSTMFADNMAGLVTQQGYLSAPNTPADHCYYYMDFDTKKIRVIAVNYYEDGVYNGKLGQTQITWFINTLLSTPTGYGVIILIHSPEDKVAAPSGYDKFMQPSPKYGDNHQPNGFYVGDRPIMQIVDAFIAKTTISTSYTDNGETVNISADFTGVDSTTEFIAYCGGHRHEDNVGYYTHSMQKQLFLGVVCGLALFGDSSNSAFTNQCDLPRGGKDVCQDAFNVYSIDRVGGNVRIARVGANVTIRLVPRDVMVIPYKD